MQVISDIHLEFRDAANYDFLKKTAPILILAGDICCLTSQQDFKKYTKFIEYIYDKFDMIIHVPGNHEYYNTNSSKKTIDEIDSKVLEYLKAYPKVHYLNRDVLRTVINGKKYYFIGCTMWSKIPKKSQEDMKELMNDYTYVRTGNHALEPADVVDMHTKAAGFLKRAIERAAKDGAVAIVITHHKPYQTESEEPPNPINNAYEVNMEKLIKPPVKVWIYGHTHKADNTVKNGVQLINNGLGYPYQRNTGYVRGLALEL